VALAEGTIPDALEGTLGALLYPDRAETFVSEENWLQLVQAIAAGDQRALHALYQRTHRIVFTLIMRITNSRETAEEVTLDVFHDVWRRAATYDAETGSVVGWIMNQARSRAIDRVRFEQRKKRVKDDAVVPAGVPAPPGPQDALDMRERRAVLARALAVLTPDERRTIEAAFFSGLSYAEVAARFAQPVGTVKTRVRSALAKLRRTLTVWEKV
jgi:RNA polymerase sigma-70 factor, ECF subfamily